MMQIDLSGIRRADTGQAFRYEIDCSRMPEAFRAMLVEEYGIPPAEAGHGVIVAESLDREHWAVSLGGRLFPDSSVVDRIIEAMVDVYEEQEGVRRGIPPAGVAHSPGGMPGRREHSEWETENAPAQTRSRSMQQDYSRARHGDRSAEKGYVQTYASASQSNIRDTGCDELERFIRAQGVDMIDRAHNNIFWPALAILVLVVIAVGLILLA